MKTLYQMFEENNFNQIDLVKEDIQDNERILRSTLFDYTKRRRMVIWNLKKVFYGDGNLEMRIIDDIIDEFLKEV